MVYNNVDWFVIENMNLEKKIAVFFKITEKEFIMTEEVVDEYKNINTRRFCEKRILSDKVGDPCYLTGNYRRPAHNFRNIIGTKKQSKFIPFMFHIFSNYHCHMFFKRLNQKKLKN